MKRIDIPIPKSCSSYVTAKKKIEKVIHESGATVSREGTLATYKDSLHWHIKHPDFKKSGVLEITFAVIKDQPQLWLTIHENRQGEWTNQIYPEFAEKLKKYFNKEGTNLSF